MRGGREWGQEGVAGESTHGYNGTGRQSVAGYRLRTDVAAEARPEGPGGAEGDESGPAAMRASGQPIKQEEPGA